MLLFHQCPFPKTCYQIHPHFFVFLVLSAYFMIAVAAARADSIFRVQGEIRDADSGERLPARLYIRSDDGRWFSARSRSSEGSAVEYRKQRSATSMESHTTLSAHPFVAELPPGHYTLTAERGKEYVPDTQQIRVTDGPAHVVLELHRWIDLAVRHWYSGDTHVHRTVAELPNIMLAEDLNVALPLTNWVTVAYTPPARGNKNSPNQMAAKLIRVDGTHVIYPVNTEYEIGSVNGRRHTLGAVFILNHQTPLDIGVPPVRRVAEEARRQGALLDLDKHSWPWSLMLVPIMDVDLFELANNHMWRTEFVFRKWTIDTKPDYVAIESNANGWTEWGWIRFGFETYYTLLNCGFRMRPTAGTASGVHPVPLGFGRIYVELPDGFGYDRWIHGLDAGRSFVTTGPMLFVTFNGKPPGHTFANVVKNEQSCRITGTAESSVPLDRIEIVVNGTVRKTLRPESVETQAGGYVAAIDATVAFDGTSWVIVRCFERHPNNRIRFAHTSPVYFEVPDQPLRPRRAEVDYLVRRMETELARNDGVLRPEGLEEYRAALRIYRNLRKLAR